MDCRGLDIIKVVLGNSFTVTVAESDAVFQQADFTFIILYLEIYGASMMKKYQMWLKYKTLKFK